ncbi:MAG TPA: PfkB family carbohydrate kinase [Acetobacteraceae bacterium]|nr:PfkB family carbohydrate kinase [Acetobacteraceae bacterium]
MADVVCLGEALIDFVPLVTGTGLAGAEVFRKAAGGAPANVAAGLARLGVSSAFMGMVGEDGFGHFLADTLAQAGVDIAPLRFTTGAHTSVAFVSLASDGDREFLFYREPGADTLLAPEDVDPVAIASAKKLHYGSISLIAEPSRSATLHAIALAREGGVRRSYDPNLREALWPSREAARAGLRLGLEQAEVVKISEEEVQFLSGREDVHSGVRALWHDGLVLVAVTRGKEGCLWFTRDDEGAVPGFAVPAVDATGAGDAFMAALLAGLIEAPDAPRNPASLDRICRFANAAGAIATTVRGAIPALPDREALDRLLHSVPADGML